MTEVTATDVHPPKVELFDLTARTNTDPKGFVRPVDEFTEQPWGLYMARPSDHPQFHYLQSWLLPDLGLRVTRFGDNPGHERDYAYYLDVGEFTRIEPHCWRSVDHYLDLLVRPGREVELVDTDELLAAHAAGLLAAEAAQAALHNATSAIAGMAEHGYSLDAWAATHGMTLTWH